MRNPDRIRHTSLLAPFAALIVGGAAGACDGTDAGRPAEDTAPPQLNRLLVQADSRGIITDLLDMQPEIACSDIDPCPASEPGAPICVIPEGKTEGTCPRALSPTNAPPALDPFAANEIRLVWSKPLDPQSGMNVLSAAAVRLVGPNGAEVPTARQYQPSGGTVASIPQLFPYGPAWVLKTSTAAPLLANTQYAVVWVPAMVADHAGRKPYRDINGPLMQSYAFTTENFSVGGMLPGPRVAPNDALSFPLNVFADEATITATTVQVKNAAGQRVRVLAFAHRTQDDKGACTSNALEIDVVPVAADGSATDWAPGKYSVLLHGIRDVNSQAPLLGAPRGTDEFSSQFTVTSMPGDPAMDTQLRAGFVLPAMCTN